MKNKILYICIFLIISFIISGCGNENHYTIWQHHWGQLITYQCDHYQVNGNRWTLFDKNNHILNDFTTSNFVEVRNNE